MKKAMLLLLICSMLIFSVACGGSADTESGQTEASQESVQTSESTQTSRAEASRVLVAYFTWADNTENPEGVDEMASPSVHAPGHVAQLASWIQERTGGDSFSIRVTEPYSSDWDECLDRANREKAEGTRPELVETVENMDDYDVIFLGYPNWWYSCPMALISFLEEYDFSGKQVYLFCSHGTGGLASSVEDITEVIPDANISDNVFDVYEKDASSSRDEVESWLQELGY